MTHHIARYAAVLLLALATALPIAVAGDAQLSAISGSAEEPRRHFRLRNPARLGPERAAALYEIIRPALVRGYAAAGYAPVRDYQQWRRFNSAPYPSVTHGNHYLSNYANTVAAEVYARHGSGIRMPVGSVLAKDSFVATETGEILLGPLFVMQKMPPGFNPGAGDWRYAMVMPDGTLFGETKGVHAERVEYCIGCHLAVEQEDDLYFVPEAFRVR